jgi:hypothetical protein
MKIPISFTITSCNRLYLLEKTINSFFNVNEYFLDEFILSDDSGDLEINEKLKNLYGEKFKIVKNKTQIGLSKSLDNLFTNCKNEYIFHCEDDWFFESNPNMILESLEILEENRNIHQVFLRHRSDYQHPTTSDVLKTTSGFKYRLLSQNFLTSHNNNWNGYSWNPGLRRKSDYLTMFPNGISHFGDEYICSQHSRNFNYLSCTLENTSCYHLGKDRTLNFKT